MPIQVPLTFQQRWLWKLTEEHPQWSSVLGYAYRIRGALNIQILQSALQKTIDRHGSLRTAIVLSNGIPEQQILDKSDYPFSILNISGEPASTLHSLIEEFCDQAIDPKTWPLFQTRLFRISDEDHVLAMAVHRLAADCYGVDLVLQDIWTTYKLQLVGGPSRESPPEPLQYTHYAIEQQAAKDKWLRSHAAFWRESLGDCPIVCWPRDVTSAEPGCGMLEKANHFFGPQISTSLRESARRIHALTANVVLALYVCVLSQVTGQSDFVIPVNIAGRQSEHKYTVGYFSHILYLRLKFSTDDTYEQLVKYISNAFFRALSHQDFGLMATDHPEYSTGVYFQWATWHDEDPSEVAMPGEERPLDLTTQRIQVRDFGEGITAMPPGMVDVEISFFDTSEGIHARGVYRADRFLASTMRRFMLGLEAAARKFIKDPSSRIDEPLLEDYPRE